MNDGQVPNKCVVGRKLVLSFLLFLIVWFSGCEKEGKFNKNKFFLIPSLMVSLPHNWQDNFVRADNLKCLTLYPSKDEFNLLRKLSRKNKQSISATVRRAVDCYFQNQS